MKTHLYRPILLPGIIGLIAVSGWGQQTIKANVPFPFQITHTEMPAGEYSVRQLQSGSPVLIFNNWEAHKTVMTLSSGRLGASSDTRPRLVFHCEDDRCSLAEIWGAAPGGGVQLPAPPVNRQERDRLAVVYSETKKDRK
jgi:hypothetical protein